MGTIEIEVPASNGPNLDESPNVSLRNLDSPIFIVERLSVFIFRYGHRKSSQVPKKTKIARADIGGPNIGKIILWNNLNSLAPSMRAASIKSSGIERQNWRIRNIPKALKKVVKYNGNQVPCA